MHLIADSGSTKTSWCLQNLSTGKTSRCQTAGMNPFFQDTGDMVNMLEKEFSLDCHGVDAIFFYGAGCVEGKKDVVRKALQAFFAAPAVTVESDLMAAARSLCGREEGIACILGTGSNSCYYDGRQIVQQVPPLGYILGDEGSGAVLGKMLVSDVLKNQFPIRLQESFFDAFDTTPEAIMEAVYRKPLPNRYLAGYTRFLSAHIDEPEVVDLLRRAFDAFFARNIAQYPEAGNLPLHFTGSIALVFKNILGESARAAGFRIGIVAGDPMGGLLRYHAMP